MLLLAAPLHDIGKIGIPDSVLLKPGPLTDEEWAVMQRHCEIGERILREQSKAVVPLFDWYAVELRSMKDALESRDPVLEMAASIALTHHEKWDGSGYPQRTGRRVDSAGVADRGDCRRLRRADLQPALPPRPARRGGPDDHRRRRWAAISIPQSTPRSSGRCRKSARSGSRFADNVVVFPPAGRSTDVTETVLYMEDDAAQARLVQKCLERAGYAVEVAGDGTAGLALYAAGPYDAVIVDQTMPGLSGLEVIRAMRPPGPLPPTIMVTGTGNEQIAVEAMKAGRQRLSRQGPRRRLRQHAAAGGPPRHRTAAAARGKATDGAGVGPGPTAEGDRPTGRRHRPRDQHADAVHRRQRAISAGCLHRHQRPAGRLRSPVAGRARTTPSPTSCSTKWKPSNAAPTWTT